MVYLRVTSIFIMTGNGNLQDFTSYHINFLDLFRKSSDFKSGGAYKIWQHLVTPWWNSCNQRSGCVFIYTLACLQQCF